MSDEASMAIALKYDEDKDGAPRVIAKGMRLKSEQIQAIAKQHRIAVMRNVSLAHALYRVEVGQEIPEALYDAVAELLNVVYALRREEEERQRRRTR